MLELLKQYEKALLKYFLVFLSAYIGIKLLEEFEPDYAWKTWGNESKKFCKEHNLEQSDCVGFAFGGDEHKELNRGTEVNRLCISKHIGDYIH